MALCAALSAASVAPADAASASGQPARSKAARVKAARAKAGAVAAKVARAVRARLPRRAGGGRALAPNKHPLSTYRLQLTPSFDFDKARGVLPYLHRLGIRTVYLSPVLQARSGSQHGYDVADPKRVNRELGGERKFRSLVSDAARLGLDLVIDVVPNHMGVGPDNKLWEDVLTHGASSRFASTFDIDWGKNGQKKIVIPTLGGKVDEVIARRELALSFEPDGAFRVRYFDKSFPIDPATAADVLAAGGPATERPAALRGIERQLRALGPRAARKPRADRAAAALRQLRAAYRKDPAVKRAVDAALAAYNGATAQRPSWKKLLGGQPYRLTYWKTGSARVNYRRFFAVNELAAVRQEDPAVFDATNAKIFDLVRIGREQGVTINLRVDHPDGLADPAGTLGAMRSRLSAINPDSQIWVESILAKEQSLPGSWDVAGTTGYDFLNELGRASVDPDGFRRIEAFYRKEILRKPGSTFAGAVDKGKRQMLRSDLAPDVRFLVDRLARIDDAGAISRSDMRDALIDVIVALPVYRTYLTDGGKVGKTDRKRLEAALRSVAPRGPGHARAVALIRRQLLGGARGAAGAEFLVRFQQLSAATTAKGLEDTAHYRDFALAALNEVGGSPEELSDDGIDEFHQAAARRDTRAMLAATTHDTKRSADARTRLSVLTWMPDAWISTVKTWRGVNRGTRGAVDANTEYLAYQMMVALWPRGGGMPDDEALASLETRVQDYMTKATREGRRKTRWSTPNQSFEADLRAFVTSMFARGQGGQRPFLRRVASFVETIDRPAIWASLSRSVVHYTAPGTADTYQGDELWNFNAVDPDNRRPVDFDRRTELLADVERFDRADAPARARFVRSLVERPQDDRLKLHVVRRALQARNANAALFGDGAYLPLRVRGGGPALLAFARTAGRQVAITLAPQGPGAADGARPTGAETWKDAVLDVPAALRGATLVDQMTGARVTLGSSVRVADLLRDFPAALFVGEVR